LVQPYSVSKPFAAVCAPRLVEAGRLDLDAPVLNRGRAYSASSFSSVFSARRSSRML